MSVASSSFSSYPDNNPISSTLHVSSIPTLDSFKYRSYDSCQTSCHIWRKSLTIESLHQSSKEETEEPPPSPPLLPVTEANLDYSDSTLLQSLKKQRDKHHGSNESVTEGAFSNSSADFFAFLQDGEFPMNYTMNSVKPLEALEAEIYKQYLPAFTVRHLFERRNSSSSAAFSPARLLPENTGSNRFSFFRRMSFRQSPISSSSFMGGYGGGDNGGGAGFFRKSNSVCISKLPRNYIDPFKIISKYPLVEELVKAKTQFYLEIEQEQKVTGNTTAEVAMPLLVERLWVGFWSQNEIEKSTSLKKSKRDEHCWPCRRRRGKQRGSAELPEVTPGVNDDPTNPLSGLRFKCHHMRLALLPAFGSFLLVFATGFSRISVQQLLRLQDVSLVAVGVADKDRRHEILQIVAAGGTELPRVLLQRLKKKRGRRRRLTVKRICCIKTRRRKRRGGAKVANIEPPNLNPKQDEGPQVSQPHFVHHQLHAAEPPLFFRSNRRATSPSSSFSLTAPHLDSVEEKWRSILEQILLTRKMHHGELCPIGVLDSEAIRFLELLQKYHSLIDDNDFKTTVKKKSVEDELCESSRFIHLHFKNEEHPLMLISESPKQSSLLLQALSLCFFFLTKTLLPLEYSNDLLVLNRRLVKAPTALDWSKRLWRRSFSSSFRDPPPPIEEEPASLTSTVLPTIGRAKTQT